MNLVARGMPVSSLWITMNHVSLNQLYLFFLPFLID